MTWKVTEDGEAAYVHYDLWRRLFTNAHRGAVELARLPGVTTWTDTGESNPMQMDAAMGAVYAIQEMLLHTVRGTLDTSGVEKRRQGRSKYGAKRPKK